MTEIELTGDLGDASEVYRSTVSGETTFTFDTPFSFVTPDSRPLGEIRVDEIHNGNVYLSTTASDGDAEFSSCAILEPDAARTLGKALVRAADYADKQQENISK